MDLNLLWQGHGIVIFLAFFDTKRNCVLRGRTMALAPTFRVPPALSGRQKQFCKVLPINGVWKPLTTLKMFSNVLDIELYIQKFSSSMHSSCLIFYFNSKIVIGFVKVGIRNSAQTRSQAYARYAIA